MGRDHDLAACPSFALTCRRREDRRNEVGKTLPGSSPRLNDEMFTTRDGTLDGGGHLQLLRSRFVVG